VPIGDRDMHTPAYHSLDRILDTGTASMSSEITSGETRANQSSSPMKYWQVTEHVEPITTLNATPYSCSSVLRTEHIDHWYGPTCPVGVSVRWSVRLGLRVLLSANCVVTLDDNGGMATADERVTSC
jgi:hypothetical protein